MSIVSKELESFKKQMWSNDQPLVYAITIVERLLLENKRMRTVMLEALHEIDVNLDAHLSEDNSELFRLLDNLCLKHQDLYDKHLVREDRQERNAEIREKLDFSNLEKSQNNNP